MATCTAQITIGGFPGGWGGENMGIGPQRIMYLIEGGRAAWVLERVVHNTGDEEFVEPVTWVPRGPERLLADALVMVAVVVERDEAAKDLLSQRLGAEPTAELLGASYVDLTKLNGELMQDVEDLAIAVVQSKLVVTAMNGSSVFGQLALLERCSMTAEVCIASWVRQPGADGTLQTSGELPPEDPDAHRFDEIRI